MYSQKFQVAYNRIESTGKKLLHYLDTLRQRRRRQGDNSEELQSIEDELKKSLKALQNQKYQVAVIAAMKAGKSTFLNSTIGADILASESEACTVCRTDVRPIEAGEIPQLLEYREGQHKPVVVSCGETAKIRQDFLDRTHQIRQTNNADKTTRFELWHPIEAVSRYSSLAGLILVDTPGPNEWESASFNTVSLKQTALEALRTSNAILYVLDYTSFKDDTNEVLLKDLIERRQDFIAENTGKIYFILNKVDRRSEKDRPIAEVIVDLKKTLISFGIPQPAIFPISALKGLLSKLIMNDTASKSHKKDFVKFFIGEYIGENFEVPRPSDIAPQSLLDSGIPTVEKKVIQTIIKNSGWNLLSEVIAKIEKQARAIQDTLNGQIWGWEIEFEKLKETVEDFRPRSESAKKKVAAVKYSVEKQKRVLISGFSIGVSLFSEEAKNKIQEEIDRIASKRGAIFEKNQSAQNYRELIQNKLLMKNENGGDQSIGWGGLLENSGDGVGQIGGNLLTLVPGVGKELGTGFQQLTKAGVSLVDNLMDLTPSSFDDFDSTPNYDPYKIRVKTAKEAKEIGQKINEFCAPLIKSWWLDTQDKLVRDGTKIREILASKIQQDIQQISNELSDYLGEALQVELNINPIQFPAFEFQGIDAKIEQQQELIKIVEKRQEKRVKKHICRDDEIYTVEIPIEQQKELSYYEVDLRQTAIEIKNKINAQSPKSKELLKRVIDKQISEDFKNAEKQINDYIERSQKVLDGLLIDRQTKEAEADKLITVFKEQKAQLEEYLRELTQITNNLDSWKPL
ncbi:MAG: dynamin family protein [Prochloraceae cyanobacterium]|nr:dynamin family protein [Prochloraceae cyanobacterium]